MATFWVNSNSNTLCAAGLVPGSIHDSIAKWEKLRDLCLEGNLVHDGGTRTCALCQHYLDCAGCPIYETTGFFDCRGTPYGDYWEAARRGHLPTATSAAEEEVVFLQSLLEV